MINMKHNAILKFESEASQPRLRILNISALYPPDVIGGAELAAHNIARSWAQLGHAVHTLTLSPPGSAITQYAVDGVQVTRLPLANGYWPYGVEQKPNALGRLLWHTRDIDNKAMARAVLDQLEHVKPDVVVTHNLQGFSTRVIKDIAATGTPVVHVMHDCSLVCVRASLFKNGKRCERRCADCQILTTPRKPHTEYASGVIAVSESVLTQHRRHGVFCTTPAKIIGNALRSDLKRIDRVSEDSTRPTTFGYIGRLESAKGIETLLRAVTTLNERGRKFAVRLAGSGDAQYVAHLKQAWPLANVEYLGFCNPADFYRNIDVLVFPSESYESFGTVIVEAYSQGVPVIASRCGGPAELVTRKTGKLVDPGNVSALADAMSEFVQINEARGCNGAPSMSELRENALSEATRYEVDVKARAYLSAIQAFTGNCH